MRKKRIWLKRSLKLALIVGLVGAGYDAWKQFEVHRKSQASELRSKLGYECASKLDDAVILERRNDFGNVDVSKLGCSETAFFVSIQEIWDMRAGKLTFETDRPIFDFTYLAGSFVAFGIFSLLTTGALYSIFATCRWIWS